MSKNDWETLEQMVNRPFRESKQTGVFNVKLVKTVTISMKETENLLNFRKIAFHFTS